MKPANGKRKPLLVLTAIVLIGALVGSIAYFLNRNFETTDDAFIDGHIVEMSPRVAAQVIAVHIDDNTEVKAGDLLLELDPRDFQVALEKAKAQLLQARAGAAQAQAQLAQAKADLAQRTAQLEIAHINFQRNASLFQKDLRAVAKEDVDTTKTTLDAAQAALDASNANVQATEAAVASSQAQAVAAQSEVDNATLQLSYTKIVAPEAGRITRKNVEAGNYVQPAQTLFSIVSHNVWVTANFKETQLTRMKPGQRVTIRVDAFPDDRLHGHVESIQLGSGSRFSLLPTENATGNFVKVVQRVPLKIVFDETPDVLFNLGPGMSAEPKVDLASQ